MTLDPETRQACEMAFYRALGACTAAEALAIGDGIDVLTADDGPLVARTELDKFRRWMDDANRTLGVVGALIDVLHPDVLACATALRDHPAPPGFEQTMESAELGVKVYIRQPDQQVGASLILDDGDWWPAWAVKVSENCPFDSFPAAQAAAVALLGGAK